MKRNWLLVFGLALVVVAVVLIFNSSGHQQQQQQVSNAPSHVHSPEEKPVDQNLIPAHFEEAPARGSLGPTLPPEQFFGKAKEAYSAVREIPQTIAQLPCYCHCDREFGHKSLYSCFEDEHASHCAVCVDEALLAYQLQKNGKLTAAQIRDRIISQYSQH
ncbi:MAG TPA: CYCXC family (seleno)protein [Pyrinomonadaceae bacterium]|nr:CYCXC family (seleno)protein [Pyrinomonadaceae bacterium]